MGKASPHHASHNMHAPIGLMDGTPKSTPSTTTHGWMDGWIDGTIRLLLGYRY